MPPLWLDVAGRGQATMVTTCFVRRGRPRQLIEMNENKRCSTLFHVRQESLGKEKAMT
jgi:hypothetical protein